MISALHWIPRGTICEKPKSFMPEETNDDDQMYESDFEREYNEEGDFMDAMVQEDMEMLDKDNLVEEMDDDDLLKATDSVLCVGRLGEVNTLEYHVFDTVERSLYIHRDVMLPDIPLSLAFSAPYLLMSSFEPHIALWHTDYFDKLEPDAYLKGHEDSVLSMDVNKQASNVLLSASADHTVRLWDVKKQKTVNTFQQHQNKVQCVLFNETEYTVYASGCLGGQVFLGDTRTTEGLSFSMEGEIECVQWGFNEYEVIASNNQGEVSCFDIRNQSRRYTIGLSAPTTFCKTIGDILVAASQGTKTSSISMWHVENEPVKLFTKNVDGPALTVKACPENPELVALSGGNTQLWDVSCMKRIRKQVPKVDAYPRKDDGVFTPYDFDESYSDDE